jgi:hypothetical protein
MARNQQPLTLPAQAGAVKITEAQLASFGIPLGDSRGILESYGPWQIPVRYTAPVVSSVWGEHSFRETITLHGSRTLYNLKESGYCLEGTVSVGGHKRRGFTSSELWELPDGRLIETATIHLCAA